MVHWYSARSSVCLCVCLFSFVIASNPDSHGLPLAPQYQYSSPSYIMFSSGKPEEDNSELWMLHRFCENRLLVSSKYICFHSRLGCSYNIPAFADTNTISAKCSQHREARRRLFRVVNAVIFFRKMGLDLEGTIYLPLRFTNIEMCFFYFFLYCPANGRTEKLCIAGNTVAFSIKPTAVGMDV